MSHRKSACTSFLLLLFLCVPPPLFYKWTMESELIHSPLFAVSNSVGPNQNGWAGSSPIQKKTFTGLVFAQHLFRPVSTQPLSWVDVGLVPFWSNSSQFPFRSNSAQMWWAQPTWLGWAQPNVFSYNIIIYNICYMLK